MRKVSEALRSSARLKKSQYLLPNGLVSPFTKAAKQAMDKNYEKAKRKLRRSSARIKKVEALRYVPGQKFSIGLNSVAHLQENFSRNSARFVKRRKDGVWEARNSAGKIVAYFGDEFARVVAAMVEVWPTDAIRRKRILRSFLDGSIRPQKKAEPRRHD